uniref:DNA-(apurinic or apyrimidinic site) endonuclease n=1 Tax=Auxenochlorella protothecoides TaxID=3075 RepID=A0A1D2AEL1_AUXPR
MGSMNLLCWNVAALAPTLKNIALKYGSLSDLFGELELDIACFQETKLVEAQLTKEIVCVDDCESYWAVSREKKGYSGVVTYARGQWRAAHVEVDCLASGESDIDREGRVVVSDHGAFVLINVYVPNAGDRPARPRLGFKLKFLHALKRTADGFRKQGRQVILVGDFNVVATPADVHASMPFDDLYAPEELAALHALTEGPAAYVDVWRRLHLGVADVYTVWDERTSARAFNRGLRIDYVLCTPGLLPSVVACEVVGTDRLPPKWSDHAGLLLRLQGLAPPAPDQPCALWQRRWESLVDTRQRSIRDMFGARGGPPKRQRRAAGGGVGGAAGGGVGGAAGEAGTHAEGEGVGGSIDTAATAAATPAGAAPHHATSGTDAAPGETAISSAPPRRKPAAVPQEKLRPPGQRSLAGFLAKQQP